MEVLVWLWSQVEGVFDHLTEYGVEYFVATVAFIGLSVIIYTILRWFGDRRMKAIMATRDVGAQPMGRRERRKWVRNRVGLLWAQALIEDERAKVLTPQEVNEMFRMAAKTLGFWDLCAHRRITLHEAPELLKADIRERVDSKMHAPVPLPGSKEALNRKKKWNVFRRKVKVAKPAIT